MKRTSSIAMGLLVMLMLAAAGCTQSGGPAANGGMNLFGRKGPENNDPNGIYTVLLQVFNDPDRHIQDAQRYKTSLEKARGWQGLRIVSQADHSELFWGRFMTVEKAKPTLLRAKNYRADNGTAIFSQAMVVSLPGADVGQKEWNIQNATGDYSLLVAVFENDPKSNPPYVDCAKDAAEYCAQLRQQGHEAYYHNGPNKSSVTVGSFGPASVRIEDKQAYQFGQDTPTIVHNLVIVEPKLLTLQKKFPKLAYNGRELINTRRDREGNIVARNVAETYVIKVPHQNERLQANDNPGNGQPR